MDDSENSRDEDFSKYIDDNLDKIANKVLSRLMEKLGSNENDTSKKSLPDLIKKVVDTNKKTDTVKILKNMGSMPNESFMESISYAEALESLGGKAEIEKFRGVSEELKKKLYVEIIDEEIQKIFPEKTDWKAFSTKLVHQPFVNSIEELYELANKAKPVFERILREISEETNAAPIIPRLKGQERALNKAHFKYRDQQGGIAFYRLTDIVRGTIEYENVEAMYAGAKEVFKHKEIVVKEFNDRYQYPKKGGYRDIQLVVEVNNFMCELQLSTKKMRQAKETSGHRNYEVFRELLAAVTDRDIDHVKAALAFGKEQLGSGMESDFMRDKNCRELPHQAAKSGNVDILDCLLDSGADVNAQDANGDTALHHAIFHGHERCVWLLLSKYKCRTDILNNEKESALLKGYFMLHGEQSEPQKRAMITLLQGSDVEEVQKIIKAKDGIIQKLLHNSRGLVDCAADGDIQKMKELMKQFSNPDSIKNGETALQAAVKNRHKDAVELLIGFGVSLSEQSGQKLIVQEALDADNTEIAYLLINAGAKCENTNWEDLVEYSRKGDIKKMESLLNLKISPDSSDDGVSALQAAVRGNHEDAVKLLLKHGAKIPESIMQEAIDLKASNLKNILINWGASCRIVAPLQKEISCQVFSSNFWNFNGIANYKNKIFCTPFEAPSVLVIDGITKEVRYIPCGTSGGSSCKWSGMARFGTKLFCAPHNANCVLVIDGESENVRRIPCDVKGEFKWSAIARFGSKLFCAPYNASSILVIDGKTEELRTIPCNVGGSKKWRGICLYNDKLFCAPYDASSVLVIDGNSEKVRFIPCDEGGKAKWSGIARYKNNLFCAPSGSSSVLVINGDTEEISSISCKVNGIKKWSDVTRLGDMLVCSPCRASSVLIIDGENNSIITRSLPGQNDDKEKWSGIVQYGKDLFCSSALHKRVLHLEDQALKLTLDQAKSSDSKSKLKETGTSFLLDFARDDNIAELAEILEVDVSPDLEVDGVSPLQVAVEEGNKKVVELLLKRKASTSLANMPCIVKSALEHGHIQIARLLCEAGACYSDFIQHAREGNAEMVKELLTELHVMPSSSNRSGVNALQAAVHGEHYDVVKLLLEAEPSCIESDSKIPIMQEALDFNRNIDIAQLLYNSGASVENVGLSPRTIPLGDSDCPINNWKWGGIATYKNKIFCSPHYSSSILVIDPDTEDIRTIPCGIEGVKRYIGIACYGNKLFCSPYNASEILVIDGDTEEIHTIPCVDDGEKKWHHIAVYGTKLFCAPYSASSVLVIDGETEEIRKIPCEEGEWKWGGIALCGNKLFCAPYDASSVLVIDGDSEEIHTIPFKKSTSDPNYTAIVCNENTGKLYCSPWCASKILVIDGETEDISYIETGRHSKYQSLGVTVFNDKIFFSPTGATSIMVADGETEELSFQPCTENENKQNKWCGVIEVDGKMFFCPFASDSILILEDRRHKLNGFELS